MRWYLMIEVFEREDKSKFSQLIAIQEENGNTLYGDTVDELIEQINEEEE